MTGREEASTARAEASEDHVVSVQPQLPAAEKKYRGVKLHGRCRRELQIKEAVHRGVVREPEPQGFPKLLGNGAFE